MSITKYSVFANVIQSAIDELSAAKARKDPDVCTPKTAESALARPDAGRRSADRSALYDFFCAIGPQGATREEAMTSCGLHTNSGYPRCAELVFDKRLVKKSGERRKTRQGNWAAVLVADIHMVGR
jgi:hypothetical protein